MTKKPLTIGDRIFIGLLWPIATPIEWLAKGLLGEPDTVLADANMGFILGMLSIAIAMVAYPLIVIALIAWLVI